MSKNQQLMSQKEKDYIASCFNKAATSAKTELNYEDIINGHKIEYDLKEDKREFKLIFGKSYRRSRKHLRPSSNTESNFLSADLLIVQLYETLFILKYLKIDSQDFKEIENSISVHFQNNFRQIANNSKFFDFLSKFFTICSEKTKFDTVKQFYLNSDVFNDCEGLFSFLDSNMAVIPVSHHFISNSLWKSNSGCLMALFLLLKDQRLFEKIYQAFIASTIVDCEYLHKFLHVLLSLCSSNQSASIKTKLKDQNIKNLKDLFENMKI